MRLSSTALPGSGGSGGVQPCRPVRVGRRRGPGPRGARVPRPSRHGLGAPADLRGAGRRSQPRRAPPDRPGCTPRRTPRPASVQRRRVPPDGPGLPEGQGRPGQRQLPLCRRGVGVPLPGRGPGGGGLRRGVRGPGRAGAAAGAEATASVAGGRAGRGGGARRGAVRRRGGRRVARARLPRALRGRPVHHLHRRYDRHAQGCDVASGGSVLRRTGRRRADRGAGAGPRGAGPAGGRGRHRDHLLPHSPR